VGTLQEHSTVAFSDTQLAVLGGLVEGAGAWGQTADLMLFYDVPTNTWTTAPALPVPLNHPNVAAVAGRIYLLGGLADVSGTWRAVPDSWVYDVEIDTWQALQPMPIAEARGSAAVGVYHDTIYLAGGIPGFGSTVATVSSFDIPSGTWTSLREIPLPAPRDHAGGVTVGSKFYVVGGRENGVGNVRDTVFILDLEAVADGWTTSPAKMPTARGGLSTAALSTKIYAFGGEGNRVLGTNGVFNQTEVYDTETDTWARLSPMAVPRHGTSAAAITYEGVSGIYIPGGGIVQGVGATDRFDKFIP
jgi:N-acetylneuraminic acid mutarotase